MSSFVCIGVPYYLGEPIAERQEVAALKRSGIAAELDADWVEITPDFRAANKPGGGG